jgi:hypothetical protein
LVVGAPGETGPSSGIDGNQTQSPTFYFSNGAAYVFVKSSGVWTQQAYVKPSNTSLGNMYFGSSVAIAEDCMVIGAPSERCSSTGVNGNQFVSDPNPGFGAAYVFRRDVSTWSQEAYLKASNSEANDNFGSDVAVSGDRVVVSAPNEKSAATGVDGNQADNSIGNAGAAYAFDREDGVWSQRAYLKASNTDNDTFGTSVAVSGGVALAGAPHEDSDATGINGDQNNEDGFRWGAAYAFYFDDTPPLLPEIVVEQPAGNSLADGDSEITFPSVEVGKSSKLEFKVKNIGQAPLENITASLHGKNAAQFVIVSQPASSLAGPDGSSSFFVKFAPKTIGPKTAILRIASNDANESPFDLTLTGNTFTPPVPDIDVQEGGDVLVDGRKTRAYGKVKVGAFGEARKFIIENKGGANLNIKLTRRGANKNDFIITLPTLFKTVLKPGQATFFWVNFKPKATGSRYAEIHIQNNDTDENPFDFRVTGFGIE